MTEPAHATLGASGAHRWMVCAGAPLMEKGLPDQSTVYAATGTAAHELGEQCLRNGDDPWDYLGGTITVRDWPEPILVDEDMCAAVDVYVQFCRGQIASADEHWIEQRVSLAPLAEYEGDVPEDMFGTADFSAYWRKRKRLSISDYKNGKGHAVEVEGNPQLRYYALGKWLRLAAAGYPVREIEVNVVQPRAPHPSGKAIRSEVLSSVDLFDWAADLIEAARRTQDSNAPRTPGEHCYFCKARGICPEFRAATMEQAKLIFDDGGDVSPAVGSPAILSPDELSRVLEAEGRIMAWIKGAKQLAHALLDRGDEQAPPRWKLVPKRARRKWTDEKQAAAALRERFGLIDKELYKQTLLSPAQVEKLVDKDGRHDLQKYVTAESSGTTLAPADDPRESVGATKANAADVFEEPLE